MTGRQWAASRVLVGTNWIFLSSATRKLNIFPCCLFELKKTKRRGNIGPLTVFYAAMPPAVGYTFADWVFIAIDVVTYDGRKTSSGASVKVQIIFTFVLLSSAGIF